MEARHRVRQNFQNMTYYLHVIFQDFKEKSIEICSSLIFSFFDERDVVLQLVAFVDADTKTGLVTVFACTIYMRKPR